MKKLALLSIAAFVAAGCAGNQAPSGSGNTNQAPQQAASNTNGLVVRSGHTTATPPPASNSSSSPNSPMQKPVDVEAQTARIEKAKKAYDAKPTDEKAKKELATAYFERAFVLTDAAQYRAALGDFRKGLKLDPEDKKAKDMHDQIIDIFKSIGREPPKEGEEPDPVQSKKN